MAAQSQSFFLCVLFPQVHNITRGMKIVIHSQTFQGFLHVLEMSASNIVFVNVISG